jgi:hypothetical protein
LKWQRTASRTIPTQPFQAFGLGENIVTGSAGFVAAFDRLLNGEDDLSFRHIARDYALRSGRSGGRGFRQINLCNSTP